MVGDDEDARVTVVEDLAEAPRPLHGPLDVSGGTPRLGAEDRVVDLLGARDDQIRPSVGRTGARHVVRDSGGEPPGARVTGREVQLVRQQPIVVVGVVAGPSGGGRGDRDRRRPPPRQRGARGVPPAGEGAYGWPTPLPAGEVKPVVCSCP